MKIQTEAFNTGSEVISTLAVTKVAYSWNELMLLEALWEKFMLRHQSHCTGDGAMVHWASSVLYKAFSE